MCSIPAPTLMRCSMPIVSIAAAAVDAWFRLFFPGVAPPIDVE
jgi:hypothetical protein